MARLKKLGASIVVDGQELSEIVDEEIPDISEPYPTVTRYIEAKEGSNFGVKITVGKKLCLNKADGLQCTIRLDGIGKDAIILQKRDSLSRLPYETIRYGVRVMRNQEWKFQKFQFAGLEIAEVQPLKQHEASFLKNRGIISVEFWRWKKMKPVKRRQVLRSSKGFESRGRKGDDGNDDQVPTTPVSEKALKGQSIHIGARFEEDEACEAPTLLDGHCVDRYPIAVLRFKYRTLEGLKQLHLVPRTPSPLPLEARPLESLAEAEKNELIMRMRNQVQAVEQRVKQERQDRNLEALRSFKQVRTEDESDDDVEAIAARPAKRRASGPDDDVIELSD